MGPLSRLLPAQVLLQSLRVCLKTRVLSRTLSLAPLLSLEVSLVSTLDVYPTRSPSNWASYHVTHCRPPPRCPIEEVWFRCNVQVKGGTSN